MGDPAPSCSPEVAFEGEGELLLSGYEVNGGDFSERALEGEGEYTDDDLYSYGEDEPAVDTPPEATIANSRIQLRLTEVVSKADLCDDNNGREDESGLGREIATKPIVSLPRPLDHGEARPDRSLPADRGSPDQLVLQRLLLASHTAAGLTLSTLGVTAQQHRAITYPHASGTLLQLVAGPGTGKTKTLVARVAHMLHNGVPPHAIVVLSMTNRAVDALRLALSAVVGEELSAKVNLHTFHAFSTKILQEFGGDYGLAETWLIIEENGWKALSRVMDTANRYQLERAVNDLHQPTGAALSVGAIAQKYKIPVDTLETVQRALEQANRKTYGDVSREALSLLVNHPEVCETIECLVIDEFQDMHPALLELAVAACRGKHLTVAGDPSQSIYQFLGSDTRTLELVALVFPDFEVERVQLDVCFRSSPEIINAAECVVRASSPLTVVRDAGPLPVLRTFGCAQDEHAFIVGEIRRLVEASHGVLQHQDMVVLASTNAALSGVQRALAEAGLQSCRLTTAPIWTTGSVANLVDLLRVLADPADDFGVMCTLGLLPRLGPKGLKRLCQRASERKTSLWAEVLRLLETNELQRSTAAVLQTLVDTVGGIRAVAVKRAGPDMVMALLFEVLELCLMKKVFPKIQSDYDRNELVRDLHGFYHSLSEAARGLGEDELLLDHFLKHYTEGLSPAQPEEVKLSTIHSAKGLEFPVVFVLGQGSRWGLLDQGVHKPNEETQRLLFVAMTRARNLLYLGLPSDVRLPSSISEALTPRVPLMTSSYTAYLKRDIGRRSYTLGALAWARGASRVLRSLGR